METKTIKTLEALKNFLENPKPKNTQPMSNWEIEEEIERYGRSHDALPVCHSGGAN